MNTPPPVLAFTYVVAFACADDSIPFVQKYTLNVDGTWLGRVPCLALCQDFDSCEYMIQHCNEQWEPLGVAGGYKSIEAAKESLESSYPGIGAKWVVSEVSLEQALAIHETELKKGGCSFCGRTPLEFTAVAAMSEVRICNHCIDEFHESLHGDDPDS